MPPAALWSAYHFTLLIIYTAFAVLITPLCTLLHFAVHVTALCAPFSLHIISPCASFSLYITSLYCISLHPAHHCTLDCISLHFAHHLRCISLHFVHHCKLECTSLKLWSSEAHQWCIPLQQLSAMQLRGIAVQTITIIELHFGVQFTGALKHSVLVQYNAVDQDHSSADNYHHWAVLWSAIHWSFEALCSSAV